jgi:C4-dicarboxylate transporter DctM subunit
MAEKLALAPRVVPFVALLTGVMIALYGGLRDALGDGRPRRHSGAGAHRHHLRRVAAVGRLSDPHRDLTRIDDADDDHRHVAALFLRDELSAHFAIGGAGHRRAANLSKWLLLTTILLMVVVLGFFLPPVSIILMTAPIILPPLKAAGFDLIWFGVVMTIVMEMGLIHPPVGLNIFVIKNIAPDIPLADIIWGVMPFVVLMAVTILLLCFIPGIATLLPNLVMG